MNNTLVKSIKFTTALSTVISTALLGLFTGSAAAYDDGVLVFQHNKAKLTCTSTATCGNYQDEQPIKVYRKNSYEMRLYWKHNVPKGEAGGSNKAYTIGAPCPEGSLNSNLEATWQINNNRPYSAEVIGCNDEYSTFDVTYTYDFPDCPGGEEDTFGANQQFGNEQKLIEICF